jgi:DNA polymerase elongation subunit (family B)
VSPVRAVAVASSAGDEVVVSGDERSLLGAVDELIAALPPGILVTWNGAAFDLPFVATRAERCGLDLGLVLRGDRSLDTRSPLPGHGGAYRARWHGHDHLDAYRVYRNDLPRLLPVSCSLKSVARLVGLAVVEEDRSALHELSAERLARYVASDARLARALAECRWSTASRFLDRLVALAA